MLVHFFKEGGGRHTYGLRADSKCSYSTELTRVAEKGKIKEMLVAGKKRLVMFSYVALYFACYLQDNL